MGEEETGGVRGTERGLVNNKSINKVLYTPAIAVSSAHPGPSFLSAARPVVAIKRLLIEIGTARGGRQENIRKSPFGPRIIT